MVVLAEAIEAEGEEIIELPEPVTEAEQTKIITRIAMPSRKLRVRISNELLAGLEKMQVNFKLN